MLSREAATPTSRNGARIGLAAAVGFGLVVLGTAARAECPWLVRPHGGVTMTSQKDIRSAYEITFDGPAHGIQSFYGFSVSSADLAWKLIGRNELPALDGALALETVPTAAGANAYRVAPETLEPHVIYLVASSTPVDHLEQIRAQLEPPRAVAMTQLMPRTRGGSDLSGPLPHLSVQGYLISEVKGGNASDLQVCAYQITSG